MKRAVLSSLLSWIGDKEHKPLILRGARQVGKTWLARELARQSRKTLLELNFEKSPKAVGFFASNDPRAILRQLESYFNQVIDPENSILFLDEIQAFPELLAKLRWFYEDLPALPIIAAGSLLEFVLNQHTFSMPVGRISYLHVEPLSFEEFLQALGEKQSYDFLCQLHYEERLPTVLHDKFMTLFKEFIFVGGLPAAVNRWIQDRSVAKVQRIHQDLLNTYRDDFSKYSGKIPPERLEEVLMSAPRFVGERFMYRRVHETAPTATIKQALQLLTQAKLLSRVYCSSGNAPPLMAEIREREFKVVLIDIGLMNAALGLTFNQIVDFRFSHQGSVSEQVVGQLLRGLFPEYVEPRLFYWSREEKGATAELDYLFAYQGEIIPIEVKSGSTGSLKSLHTFMALKKKKLAVRINQDLPSFSQVSVKVHSGEVVEYPLLSIPFYLLGQLPRLLQGVFLSL